MFYGYFDTLCFNEDFQFFGIVQPEIIPDNRELTISNNYCYVNKCYQSTKAIANMFIYVPLQFEVFLQNIFLSFGFKIYIRGGTQK